MNASINFTFNGDCAAAFRHYERCLAGKILFELTWGDSPMAKEVPPEWVTKICHATLEVAGITLHGVDTPSQAFEPPRGFCILLDIDEPAEAERVFDELAPNGRVDLPLRETFWAHRYGKVVDQFGVPWEVNCGKSVAAIASR
jgi:PhnB protein